MESKSDWKGQSGGRKEGAGGREDRSQFLRDVFLGDREEICGVSCRACEVKGRLRFCFSFGWVLFI